MFNSSEFVHICDPNALGPVRVGVSAYSWHGLDRLIDAQGGVWPIPRNGLEDPPMVLVPGSVQVDKCVPPRYRTCVQLRIFLSKALHSILEKRRHRRAPFNRRKR